MVGDSFILQWARVSILLFSLLLLAPLVFPLQESAAQSSSSITGPWCSIRGDVPPNYSAAVFVNVTSNVPIRNVTLYFVARNVPEPSQITNWRNLSIYTTELMEPNFPYSANSTRYAYELPSQPNNTIVFGFAKIIDAKGDILFTGGQPYPLQICTYSWPKPGAELDMGMWVLDINPRYLNLTAKFGANLYNSETFNWITISDPYSGLNFPVNKLQGSNLDYWTGQTTNVALGYFGLTQLFPVDSYTYQMELSLSGRLNYSEVTINNHVLAPNATVPDVIGFTNSPTLSQNNDLSAWNMTSLAQYLPKQGVIMITLQTTRQLGEVTNSILIPLLSVYALLGLSILLIRRSDLANRLVLYLTVFLFSFELDSFMRSQVVSPLSSGSTMADLLVLALIPCTVVLAGASIIGWIPKLFKWRLYVDLAGVVGALGVLLLEAKFDALRYVSTVSGGHFQDVTFWVYDLGPWGRGITLALLSGSIIMGAYYLFDRLRTKKKWLGDSYY